LIPRDSRRIEKIKKKILLRFDQKTGISESIDPEKKKKKGERHVIMFLPSVILEK
jgi:hypothetical protein